MESNYNFFIYPETMQIYKIISIILLFAVACFNLCYYVILNNEAEEEVQRGIKKVISSFGNALSQDEKNIVERVYKLDNIQLNKLYEEKVASSGGWKKMKEERKEEEEMENRKEEEKDNVKEEEKEEDEEEMKKKMDEEQSRLNDLLEGKIETTQSPLIQEKDENQQSTQNHLNEKFFMSDTVTVMPPSSIFNSLYTTSIEAPPPFTAEEVTYEELPEVPYPHVKDHVMTLSPAEKESLAMNRNRTKPEPVNLAQLRVNFSQGLQPSYIFDNRPRSDFYTISHANETEKMPLLMDTFSYCIDDDLYMEAIFSLKYMYNACGRVPTREALKDTWYAVYKHKRSLNRIQWDTHKHSVVTSFLFPHSCINQNQVFYIYSENTHFNYTFTAVHIPDFTTRKYYLAACTSIDQSHPMQVKAWLNYNYFHGIEHVTIYLNAKPDFWHHQLDHYVRHGYLDLVEYTYPNHRYLYEQPSALNACNRRYLYASKFVIYNDVDEYFLPMNTTWRIVDVVHFYDNQFPKVAAFRVYNTFHGCKNYSYFFWEKTSLIREICPYRYWKVIKEMRWKNIVKPLMAPVIQVHHISYGVSFYMDHWKDMVMLHFKMGMHKKPQMPYDVNLQIENEMRDIL